MSNRIIKYRVWCETHNRWEYYTLGDLICGFALSTNGEGMFNGSTWAEWTGLTDKNGVEIYEGDILKQPENMSYRFKECGEVFYESDYGGFIVKGEWSKNQHHEQLTCDVAIDCSVIGNIHQHKHLLP